MRTLKVTLLGTGTPRLQTNRYGSSALVEAGAEKLIIDCGRCTLQRLFENGTPMLEVNKLFLTHLHSDHTVGIPDLWLTPWAFGRKGPLFVWGPKGTRKMMAKFEEAFEFDLQMRPVHDKILREDARVECEEIEEGLIYEAGGLGVTAFEVDHRPVRPAYGYRIDFEGRSVVISGDTRFSENLIRFSQGVDVLFHNVAGVHKDDTGLSERERSISDLHLTPEEAGEVFSRSSPKLAVYTHMVLYSDIGEIISRTRKTYDGPLEIGEDLMSFHVGDTVRVIRP
ncbi:MAG: MBL fold metallo-hydrolase [Deltaproteobacteria bacterium]|nr:MBL fold metallo-hydrolase [Deltaproteobacteria bacterium]MBW2137137.1 MBL fold metallo-hydrolase [Deltaproteobacteria bacterium]